MGLPETLWGERQGTIHNIIQFPLTVSITYSTPAAELPYFERALVILEAALGPDHPSTQITRGNLEALGDA